MSKRNSLKRRKVHHEFLVRQQRELLEKEKRKKEKRQVRKDQKEVMDYLASGLNLEDKSEQSKAKLQSADGKDGEVMTEVEPSDLLDRVMKPKRGIRKNKKDRRRLRKIKARMEASGMMVD